MKLIVQIAGVVTFFGALHVCGATAEELSHGRGAHSRDLIFASDKIIPLVIGNNQVDSLHTITCKSTSGCLIEIAPSIEIDSSIGVWTCAYVDGVATNVKPKCGKYNFDTVLDLKQRALVSQGQHTLQLFVHSDNNVGSIDGWEVNYAIYELKQTTNTDD